MLLLGSLVAWVQVLSTTFVSLRWHDEDDKRLHRKNMVRMSQYGDLRTPHSWVNP